MPGIFIGVSFSPRAYKIYIPAWKTIKLARTVVFNEVKIIQNCFEQSCHSQLTYRDLFRQAPSGSINISRLVSKQQYFDESNPPKNFHDIQYFSPCIREKWYKAYSKEIDSIANAGGMSVVDVPKDMKLIRLRELFVIKVDQVTGEVVFEV